LVIRIIFLTFILSWIPTVSAETDQSIEERVNGFEIRSLAAQDLALSRTQLIGLCRGLEGARWCEGYIAAILTSLQIPRNSVCLPITDVAPFLYGNVWELTLGWLYLQPENLELPLYDAIYTSLSEQDQCDI